MAKIPAKHEYIARRRVARKLSLMAFYQWHINASEFSEILSYYQQDEDMAADLRKADASYFQKLVEQAIDDADEIDEIIKPFLDRELSQVGPIEHSVLLLATVELQHHLDVGYKTVVNEWVNLCKRFGPEKSYKFINAVLEKLVMKLRHTELTDSP
ncbi:MAG: transcription antitermination factor NusB [Thiotrichaceae bacterium]|nr:transcription antitermination factor NusB [Thiotrichaceae bacterium]